MNNLNEQIKRMKSLMVIKEEEFDPRTLQSDVETIVGDMLGNTILDPDTNMISHRFGWLPTYNVEGFKHYYMNNPNHIPTDRIRESMVGIYKRFWPSIEDTELQDEVWKKYIQGIYKHIIPQQSDDEL